MAAADEELGRCAVQIAVALLQGTACKGHVVGDIDLDAAEVIHHFHQRLHVDGDIVVDGELVLVVDDLCQSRHIAAVGESHRVDLVVRGGIGLAVGEGDLPAFGRHQTVAGDLQHPECTALDVELAVQDHIRHAVVGAIGRISAAVLVVDAADEDVDHVALVLLQRLDLLHQRSSVLLRLQVLLHPVYHAGRIDHDARNDGQHRQRHGQREPHGGSFFLLSGLGAAAAGRLTGGRMGTAPAGRRGSAAVSTGACCRGRMRRGSRTGPLLRMRHRRLFEEIRLALQRSRAGGRSLRRPLFRRAVQRALGVDAARSLTHS